mmetsp:Transcript_16911/g.29118  ORF Transcript_16911/g.29118 Transcript_16911/m.29118 type:complete len:186 (+) Transcript_16911:144-701(+)
MEASSVKFQSNLTPWLSSSSGQKSKIKSRLYLLQSKECGIGVGCHNQCGLPKDIKSSSFHIPVVSLIMSPLLPISLAFKTHYHLDMAVFILQKSALILRNSFECISRVDTAYQVAPPKVVYHWLLHERYSESSVNDFPPLFVAASDDSISWIPSKKAFTESLFSVVGAASGNDFPDGSRRNSRKV